MCGIYGEFPFDQKLNPNLIINALAHRGPDDNGYLKFDDGIFVHTRLSIIDLSQNAKQPMSSKCGRYHIIYNGEIYNFLELKKDLIKRGYNFYSNSDTEVILVGFLEWKHELFNKLNGMFAFSIYDKSNKELFLVRDRVGVKPLYFIFKENKISFSSEVSALNLFHKLEIDPNSLYDCIQYGAFLGNKTIYKDVYSLEPGHFIKFKFQNIFEKKKYAEVTNTNCHEYVSLSYNDAKKILRNKLDKAIESQLISDTPVGCLLSGGIDSSAILALAQSKLSNPLFAFNLAFNKKHFEYDESKIAESTAKYLGAKFQKIEMGSNDVEYLFNKFILSLDQPSNDGFNTYLISNYVSKFAKVALTGLGGDELFGGYSFYLQIQNSLKSKNKFFDQFLSNLHEVKKNRFTYSSHFRTLGAHDSVRSFRKLFSNSELKLAINIKKEIVENYFNLKDTPILKQILLSEMKQYLPNTLLRNTDNLSMANGLELRPIFLDNDLINFAMNLNDDFKISNSRQKSILIDSVSDLLPKELLKISKKGFELPFSYWMNNELSEQAISLFQSSVLDEFINDKFKKNLIKRAVKKTLKDRDWIFLVIYSWMSKNKINQYMKF
jgi:asparagine synthase (glutamine-hydrolysing)